jgi:hypothetical protein
VEQRRNFDFGALIFGLIVLGVGVYYFLANTLGLQIPDLDWDKIWPLLVVALGCAILFSNLRRKGGTDS